MIEFPFETSLIIYIAVVSLVLGVLSFIGLIFKKIKRTVQRIRRNRFERVSFTRNISQFTLTFLWIAVSAAVLFLAAFIQSYQKFTRNVLVAEVRCIPLADSENSLYLQYTPVKDGKLQTPQTFLLNGDQWALEGQILKWDDWLNFFGVHTMFKMTRVRGRYVNFQDEIDNPPSVYSLVEHEEDPQWRWLFKYGHKIRFVTAVYGNTVFTYPSTNQVYEIFVSTSGFMAKVREEYDN
ncbi:MAG: hypothetical protein ACE5HS_14380 [bacterium]